MKDMKDMKCTVSKKCYIEGFSLREIKLRLSMYLDNEFITVALDKDITEFSAKELKEICANEIFRTFPDMFKTLADVKQFMWYFEYDVNARLVSRPYGKGIKGILGVTVKGELFVNEDEGCWTKYCNTDDWEKQEKVDVVNQLYNDINEFGYPMPKDSCEQLVTWIFEAKVENTVISTKKLQGRFNKNFDPISPMNLFDSKK